MSREIKGWTVLITVVLMLVTCWWIGTRMGKSSLANRLCKSSGYDVGAEQVNGDWYCILGEPDRRVLRLEELVRDVGR